MHPHGSLDGGLEDGQVFQGSIASARLHELEHKVLSGAQVNDRYPGYHLLESSRAVFQPEGGYVKSELGIVTHVQAAQAAGADIRARERVLGWEARPGGEGVVVNTARDRYEAGRLVLAAGAWMADLAPVLRGIAVPERQVLAWLQPTAPALFTPERFPVFNLEVAEGRYYGLPVVDIPGFKFGRYHHREEHMPAEAMRREVDAEDKALLRAFAARYFLEGNGATMALRACMFTDTPDEHFLVDRHHSRRQRRGCQVKRRPQDVPRHHPHRVVRPHHRIELDELRR